MTFETPKAVPSDLQAQAADAFDVHAALVSIEVQRPYLKNNPRWQLIRMDAYEALISAWDDAS